MAGLTGLTVLVLLGSVVGVTNQWERIRPLPPTKRTPTPLAQLVSLQGVTLITRGDKDLLVRGSEDVFFGDRVEAAGRQTVSVAAFPDGTQLQLLPNACIRLAGEFSLANESLAGRATRKLSIEAGRLRVRAPAGMGIPMLVATPRAELLVEQAEFVVTIEANWTKIDVEQGAVRLYNKNKPAPREITAGHHALVAQDTAVAETEQPAPPMRGPGRRTDADLVLLYLFRTGRGNVIRDVAGLRKPLNLLIADPRRVRWLARGGLQILQPVKIASGRPPLTLIYHCNANSQLSLELWLTPAAAATAPKAEQTEAPGCLLRLATDQTQNFALRHRADRCMFQLSTTETGPNPTYPVLLSRPIPATPRTCHVVCTWRKSGKVQIYVNGRPERMGMQMATGRIFEMLPFGSIRGELKDWDETARLTIASELDGKQPWLGTYHLVAAYCRALSEEEILGNYAAGPQQRPAARPARAVGR